MESASSSFLPEPIEYHSEINFQSNFPKQRYFVIAAFTFHFLATLIKLPLTERFLHMAWKKRSKKESNRGIFLTGVEEHTEIGRPNTADNIHALRTKPNCSFPGSLPRIIKRERSKENSIYSDDEKFFGLPGREIFFERYKWLSRQRSIMHTSNKETSFGLMFDNEVERDDPFSSRQPNSARPSTPSNSSTRKTNPEDNFADDESMTEAAFAVEIEELLSNTEVDPCPPSPRSAFIASCIRDKLLPRASLMVRKKFTTEFRLPHQGIGDKMALLLAASLEGIPRVELLDLRDNHLTDVSLSAMSRALLAVPYLLEIDLSENVVGMETAAGLAKLIKLESCTLRRLVLQETELEDRACNEILIAMRSNSTIQELNLSKNRIGDSIVLRAILPDLMTGGDALAQLIRSPTCSLSHLDVSWNRIRGDGAVAFARSFATNKTITYVNISDNALGHDGGLALGDAMIENRTLRTLLIANNGLDSSAAFTLSIGILENLSLRTVCMDGNPIGEAGAKALMQVPVVAGMRVRLSLENCNVIVKDDRCFFDLSEPFVPLSLRLDRPFDRAVAFKLLEMVASNGSYVFRRLEYEESTTMTSSTATSTARKAALAKRIKPVPISLLRGISREKLLFQDPEQRELSERLQMVMRATSEISVASILFSTFDEDRSGDLNRNEIFIMLEFLGLGQGFDKHQQKELLDGFKSFSNEEGCLELFEFSSFLKSEKREFATRLRLLTEIPGRDSTVGVLHIEVADSYSYTASDQRSNVLTSIDQEHVLTAAGTGSNSSKLIMFALQNSRIRYNEAYNIYTFLNRSAGDSFRTLSHLLPR
eukprot:gene5508-11103_t